MTVKEIVCNYLRLKGFDGLHSHPENNRFGGCGCSLKDYQKKGCPFDEMDELCEPAYKHTKEECKKCPDYKECEAFENGEKIMYCGKKRA